MEEKQIKICSIHVVISQIEIEEKGGSKLNRNHSAVLRYFKSELRLFYESENR